jgi:hypothetical protein
MSYIMYVQLVVISWKTRNVLFKELKNECYNDLLKFYFRNKK